MPAAAQEDATEVPEADSLDQKGNRYFRRKLLQREFLRSDLMRLTFELPGDTSLQRLGFDIGLGDFVRLRPSAPEHQRLVENPAGGRAYSPILHPKEAGKFSLIVKVYGPGGMSSLLSQISLGSDVLVSSNVEHVFWKERNRGYYANERNIAESEDGYSLGLIAFGIGITEIAPVALSELLDPRVKRVTIIWANKGWKDVEWLQQGAESGESGDLVHRFFSEYQSGKHGDRLHVKHVLSQEKRAGCFEGRIREDILREVFPEAADVGRRKSMRFLSVGTTAMTAFAYEQLAKLGFDISMQESWSGENLLYRKLEEAKTPFQRTLSPLLASDALVSCGACPEEAKAKEAATSEPPLKRQKV